MLSGVWHWIGASLHARLTYLLLACLAVLVALLLPSNYDTFITVKNATVTHYFAGMGRIGGTGSGTAYLQTADGTLYYYVARDFTPALESLQSTRVTLTYASQQTMLVDVQSTNSATHLAGRGFRVVSLISYDQSGQPSRIFTTNDYRQHPSGYYHIGMFSPASFVLAFAALLFLITLAFPLLIRSRSISDPSTSARIHTVRPGLHDTSAYLTYPPVSPALKPEPETPPALPAQPVPPQQTKKRVGTQFRRPGF